MYWYNELTIAMNNKKAATAAMTTAKNVLTTTSIEEYCKGEFTEFADSLLVKKNEVRSTGLAGVWGDTYELVLHCISSQTLVVVNFLTRGNNLDSVFGVILASLA